jgi:hypothetical protein
MEQKKVKTPAAKKANKTNVVKGSTDGSSIIINNLVVRTANRGTNDIGGWRTAHRQAEAVLGTGSRVLLYDLFDDILLDPHLSAVVDKRIMSITNHKLRFVNDSKEVEEVSKIIKTKGFRELLREMMLAHFWGITLVEVSQDRDNNIISYSVPRKHIRPRTQQIVKGQYDADGSGINYREGMYLNTCVEVGTPNGLGLLLKAAPFVLYKRGCWGNWAQYAEVFGMPTKIGRYNGYDEATRIALERALDEAGSALSIVLPKEADLSFLESKTTAASGDLYKDLGNACDEQLSILVLGQTETTKSSQSSGYAQSNTHSKQQEQIADDDRAYMLGYLETEVRRVLKAMGYPMDGGEWQFEQIKEQVSLKDRVVIDTTLRDNGLPIDDDYFYETYSIPKPKDYDAVKKETPPKKDPGTPKKDILKNHDGANTITVTLDDLKDFFALATPTV